MNSAPVVYADSSEARRTTSAATSSGVPKRRSGVERATFSVASCVLAVCAVEVTAVCTMRVSVMSSPARVPTALPRDITITWSQRPSSSFASEEATTTGMPEADTSRRMR